MPDQPEVIDVHAALRDALTPKDSTDSSVPEVETPEVEPAEADDLEPETQPDDDSGAVSDDKLESMRSELETLRSKFSSVAEKEEALKNLAAELKPAAQVRDLLKSPGFRKALEKALSETNDPDFEWGHPDDGGASADRIMSKFLDPRVDEMKAELEALKYESQQKAVMDNRSKLDSMYESFAEEYSVTDDKGKKSTPVTPELWKRIETEASTRYGNELTLELIEAHGYATLRKIERNGTNGKNGASGAQKLIERLAREPKGSRIVAGPGKRKETGETPLTNKDPKDLKADDWRDLLTRTLEKSS